MPEQKPKTIRGYEVWAPDKGTQEKPTYKMVDVFNIDTQTDEIRRAQESIRRLQNLMQTHIHDGRTSAFIRATIASPNFKEGQSGWRIGDTGYVEINDGVFRGQIEGASIDIPDDQSSGFHVDTSGNMWSGSATLGGSSFAVTSAGVVSMNNAGLNGELTVGPTGAIAGGQTSYNNGDGFWLGGRSGGYYVSIGNASYGNLTYNGSTQVLTISNATISSPIILYPTITIYDNQLTIQDNLTPSKQFQFQASSISAATTRTLTVPDFDSTIAVTANNLSVFAATTSAQLAGVISDETGSGSLVFGTSPGFTTAANPVSNDGATLGTTALKWSDLFLASGAVINFNSGDVTITHATDTLAFAGASAANGYTFDAVLKPSANDAAALGSATVSWADLFLASGAVLNFNNGNITLTHAAGTLTLAGGTLVLPASGLQIGSSNPFSDSSGTLTLQNVDALDATTTATIQGAIDNWTVVSTAINYAILDTDDFIICTAALTATLPTAVGRTGKTYTIKSTTTDTVTINTTSSQTIDGSTSLDVVVQYAAVTVVSDGANWHIV